MHQHLRPGCTHSRALRVLLQAGWIVGGSSPPWDSGPRLGGCNQQPVVLRPTSPTPHPALPWLTAPQLGSSQLLLMLAAPCRWSLHPTSGATPLLGRGAPSMGLRWWPSSPTHLATSTLAEDTAGNPLAVVMRVHHAACSCAKLCSGTPQLSLPLQQCYMPLVGELCSM